LLIGASQICLLILGDLWKLTLFRAPTSRHDLPVFGDNILAALDAGRQHALALGAARVLRGTCTTLLGVALAFIVRAPWGTSPSGTLTLFLLTQAVVVCALGIELAWLFFAATRLERCAVRQPWAATTFR
jgi:hypothetical protein